MLPQLVACCVVLAGGSVFQTRPLSTTWLEPSPFGLSRIGFIAGSGSRPQASAWATCARPISPPWRHGYELFDMFCALNGATATPLAAQPGADRRGHPALAGVRRRAADEDRSGRHQREMANGWAMSESP